MSAVTQWFSTSKPKRVGAYELMASSPTFAWWNGKKWSVPHCTPAGAMGCAGFDTPWQPRVWRGLAVKP